MQLILTLLVFINVFRKINNSIINIYTSLKDSEPCFTNNSCSGTVENPFPSLQAALVEIENKKFAFYSEIIIIVQDKNNTLEYIPKAKNSFVVQRKIYLVDNISLTISSRGRLLKSVLYLRSWCFQVSSQGAMVIKDIDIFISKTGGSWEPGYNFLFFILGRLVVDYSRFATDLININGTDLQFRKTNYAFDYIFQAMQAANLTISDCEFIAIENLCLKGIFIIESVDENSFNIFRCLFKETSVYSAFSSIILSKHGFLMISDCYLELKNTFLVANHFSRAYFVNLSMEGSLEGVAAIYSYGAYEIEVSALNVLKFLLGKAASIFYIINAETFHLTHFTITNTVGAGQAFLRRQSLIYIDKTDNFEINNGSFSNIQNISQLSFFTNTSGLIANIKIKNIFGANNFFVIQNAVKCSILQIKVAAPISNCEVFMLFNNIQQMILKDLTVIINGHTQFFNVMNTALFFINRLNIQVSKFIGSSALERPPTPHHFIYGENVSSFELMNTSVFYTCEQEIKSFILIRWNKKLIITKSLFMINSTSSIIESSGVNQSFLVLECIFLARLNGSSALFDHHQLENGSIKNSVFKFFYKGFIRLNLSNIEVSNNVFSFRDSAGPLFLNNDAYDSAFYQRVFSKGNFFNSLTYGNLTFKQRNSLFRSSEMGILLFKGDCIYDIFEHTPPRGVRTIQILPYHDNYFTIVNINIGPEKASILNTDIYKQSCRYTSHEYNGMIVSFRICDEIQVLKYIQAPSGIDRATLNEQMLDIPINSTFKIIFRVLIIDLCNSVEEILSPGTQQCEFCPRGYFKQDENTCSPCTEIKPFLCPGYSVKLVKKGYFFSPISNNFFRCLNMESCKGLEDLYSESLLDNPFSFDYSDYPIGYCAVGQGGLLCGACDKGFGYQEFGKCEDCFSGVLLFWKILRFILFYAIFTVFITSGIIFSLTRLTRQSSLKLNPKRKLVSRSYRTSKKILRLVKHLINHFQVLTIIVQFFSEDDGPPRSSWIFFYPIFRLLALKFEEAYPEDCWGQLMQNSHNKIFPQYIFLLIFLLSAILAANFLFIFFISKLFISTEEQPNIIKRALNFITGREWLLIFWIIYFNISFHLSPFFKLFACAIQAGENTLVYDIDGVCFSSEHNTQIMIALLTFVTMFTLMLYLIAKGSLFPRGISRNLTRDKAKSLIFRDKDQELLVLSRWIFFTIWEIYYANYSKNSQVDRATNHIKLILLFIMLLFFWFAQKLLVKTKKKASSLDDQILDTSSVILLFSVVLALIRLENRTCYDVLVPLMNCYYFFSLFRYFFLKRSCFRTNFLKTLMKSLRGDKNLLNKATPQPAQIILPESTLLADTHGIFVNDNANENKIHELPVSPSFFNRESELPSNDDESKIREEKQKMLRALLKEAGKIKQGRSDILSENITPSDSSRDIVFRTDNISLKKEKEFFEERSNIPSINIGDYDKNTTLFEKNIKITVTPPVSESFDDLDNLERELFDDFSDSGYKIEMRKEASSNCKAGPAKREKLMVELEGGSKQRESKSRKSRKTASLKLNFDDKYLSPEVGFKRRKESQEAKKTDKAILLQSNEKQNIDYLDRIPVLTQSQRNKDCLFCSAAQATEIKKKSNSLEFTDSLDIDQSMSYLSQSQFSCHNSDSKILPGLECASEKCKSETKNPKKEVAELKALIDILWKENKALRKEISDLTYKLIESTKNELFNIDLKFSGVVDDKLKERPRKRIFSKFSQSELSKIDVSVLSSMLFPQEEVLTREKPEELDMNLVWKKNFGNTPKENYLHYALEIKNKSDSEKIRLLRLSCSASPGLILKQSPGREAPLSLDKGQTIIVDIRLRALELLKSEAQAFIKVNATGRIGHEKLILKKVIAIKKSDFVKIRSRGLRKKRNLAVSCSADESVLELSHRPRPNFYFVEKSFSCDFDLLNLTKNMIDSFGKLDFHERTKQEKEGIKEIELEAKAYLVIPPENVSIEMKITVGRDRISIYFENLVNIESDLIKKSDVDKLKRLIDEYINEQFSKI